MDTATRCPLCGNPNACGVALGQGTCWCFTTAIAPDVLARVPVNQREQACVCQRCAERNPLPRDAEAAPPPDQSREDPT